MQLNWTEIIEYVIKFIIISAIGGVSAYFLTFIKVKKQELLEKVKNETVKKYIEMLDKTVSECVLATNQTFVDALKKTNSFDTEAQKQAFKTTFDAVKSMLTDEAQKYLTESVKDLDTYISNKIEAQIRLNH